MIIKYTLLDYFHSETGKINSATRDVKPYLHSYCLLLRTKKSRIYKWRKHHGEHTMTGC